MEFAKMNWMQVEAYLANDDRLILILGATEEHGYLSLLTDALTPQRMAQAAAQQTGVLVAPPLPFGCSPYFLSYPGTLSLRGSTLLAVVEDVLRSAYGQGFRRFLVLNGHGGNRAVQTYLYELANSLPGFKAQWYEWWLSPMVQQIAQKYSLQTGHANWMEAFDFTRVDASFPEEDKPTRPRPPIMDAGHVRAIFGDGSHGGAYLAPENVMTELFNACLSEILDLLAFD